MATLEMFGIALLLLILFAGACFYLYSRMTYSEKRIGLMESILLDVKLAMESVEDSMRAPMPMTPPFKGFAPADAPKPSEKVMGDSPNDEQFYAELLKEVTAEHSTPLDSMGGASLTEVPTSETILDAQLGVAPPAEAEEASVNPTPAPSPYDTMSRQDLLNLIEKRGLRVTKRAGRGEMISVLRNSDSSANRPTETGTENGSAAIDSSLAGPSPLDSKPLEEVLSV
jgi:hypothetical protein